MAEFLPPATQKFIADTREYNDPLAKSAQNTRQFGRAAEEASITARKAFNNARDAAEKLSIAQREAAEAAEKLKKNEIDEAAAAELAAKATKAKERADIAARESALAAAKATDKQADNLRQLARDAAIADATIMLANLKATGSAKQHAAAVKEVQQAFPELKNSANSAFKAIGNNGSSAFKAIEKNGTASMGLLQKGGIVLLANAIAQLPFIAGVAGGAITLAFGGAMSAIGLMVQAKSPDIKRGFSKLAQEAGAELKKITAPFHDTLLQVLVSAKNAMKDMEPALKGMFDNIAPALTGFVQRLGNSFQMLNPMFTSLGKAFASLLNDLGPRMNTIMNNLGTAFKAIFDAINKNPEALGKLIEDISMMIRYGGDAIGFLIRFKDQFDKLKMAMGLWAPSFGQIVSGIKFLGGGLETLFPSMKKNNDELQIGGGRFKAFGQSTDNAAGSLTRAKQQAIQPMISALNIQKLSVDQLKQAWDRLTGANQSAATAEINMHQAIADTTAAIKENGHTLDVNTQKGRDNYKQLIATAQAFQDDISAMKNDHATAGQLRERMAQLRATFINLAYQMTGNRKEAVQLADKLLGIAAASKKIPRTVRQDIYQVMHLTASQAYLNKRKNILGYKSGGPVKVPGFADGGGPVSGPGTERSDSILAFLSNNEFVVNAKQAKKHMGLLLAINAGVKGFARGGPVIAKSPKHAASHPFTGNTRPEFLISNKAAGRLGAYRIGAESAWMMRGGAGSGGTMVVQHAPVINVHVYGTVVSQRELDDHIQEIVLQRNLRNPTSGVNLPSGRVG